MYVTYKHTRVNVCVNVNFVLDCISKCVYKHTRVNVCVNVNFVLDCISKCVYRHTRVIVCPVNALDCIVLMTQSDRKLRHHNDVCEDVNPREFHPFPPQ